MNHLANPNRSNDMAVTTQCFRWHGFVPFRVVAVVKNIFWMSPVFAGNVGKLQERVNHIDQWEPSWREQKNIAV